MAGGTTELDRWARALGAGTDADALSQIEPVRKGLMDSLVRVLWVEKALQGSPDPDVLIAVRQAGEDAINLWSAVELVKGKFERHLRGDQ